MSLDSMLAKLKKLEGMPEKAAPEVAIAVREALIETIAQGQTPEGKAWDKTKEGKQALQTAGESLRVTSIGPRVFAALNGHVARHNNGTARGRVQRRVLPAKGQIPTKMGKRIEATLRDVFRDIVGQT